MHVKPSSTLLNACGLDGFTCSPVHGGDINQAFRLTRGDKSYFLKVNDAKRYSNMLAKEARSLKSLKGKTTLYVPEVMNSGEAEGTQYLVLEWLEKHTADEDYWQNLGNGLAALHRQTQSTFGWEEDNYIGSLPQANTGAESWDAFYAERRILPLVKQLYDGGQMTKQDLPLSEKFCARLDQLFPKEPAALLHGDLWSGNITSCTKGPAVFDPATYYGHREMDLGMSLLFGGFAESFYQAYESARPPEKSWRQRVPLTQLYPLLVHACLFGGHYIDAARKVMCKFV